MKRPCSPALRLASVTFMLLLATSLAAAGCGGSLSSPSMSGDAKVTSSAEPVPHNVNEAEAQLALAEQHVFGAFGQYKPEAQSGFAQPPGQTAQQPAAPLGTATTEASPPPPPNDKEHMAKEGEARTAAPATSGADVGGAASSPCETACRALASMNRAVTHICSLAGDDSDNCVNARERVRAATERVRQSCSECSNG